MSGPNGDPNITIDDSIIEDDDDFNEEGKGRSFRLAPMPLRHMANHVTRSIKCGIATQVFVEETARTD